MCLEKMVIMKKWGILLSLIGFSHEIAQAGDAPYVTETDQIIVKFRRQDNITPLPQQSDAHIHALSVLAGVPLAVHRVSAYGHILKLPGKAPIPDAHEIARRISASSDVLYAEPDKRLFLLNTPNDPSFPSQWNLQDLNTSQGGINLPSAWDITTGAFSVTIAVIDSGILPHADLNGRLLPGYDFISDISKANDGDGRDDDPSDPGDWITAEEAAGAFSGCPVSNSSWHGTHVAGTIGAISNNGIGIAGINWTSRILPVRTMGKCGGYLSDMADGLRWAAGLPVSGVPANSNPAKVINLSLGGSGSCSVTEQNAINDAVLAGAVVVVAAGNETLDVVNVSPANCHNVIAVAATDSFGSRASYTNYGRLIDISAPGGDSEYAGGTILATGDGGRTTPNRDNAYTLKQGTSMAAPHVSGVASLMLAVNSALTPTTIENILRATARPFPVGTAWDCTTADCGAGILDATAALNASFASSIPVQVNGMASGSMSSLSLNATIQPVTGDLNRTVNVYVGGRLGAQWFLRAGADWVPWSGGALPVYASMAASAVIDIPVALNMDVRGLSGAEVYVGYGQNDADMLSNLKFGLVYTVP